ncbi:MAG: hypothetical protein ACLFQV_04305, partial [Vulcanimicrobiota bacterium]
MDTQAQGQYYDNGNGDDSESRPGRGSQEGKKGFFKPRRPFEGKSSPPARAGQNQRKAPHDETTNEELDAAALAVIQEAEQQYSSPGASRKGSQPGKPWQFNPQGQKGQGGARRPAGQRPAQPSRKQYNYNRRQQYVPDPEEEMLRRKAKSYDWGKTAK